MADSKQAAQAQLVHSIADGVHAKLAADFAKLTEQLAKLSVTSNSIVARLETLESTTATGGATAKRAVRGAGAAKGAAKGATKKVAGEDDTSKVTNSLLYFRYAMRNNLDDYQETYGTEENLTEAEKDPALGKKDRDKNPSEWWSAAAAAIWKLVLSDDLKKEVRTQYEAWKEGLTREAAEPQLGEEAAE